MKKFIKDARDIIVLTVQLVLLIWWIFIAAMVTMFVPMTILSKL